MRIGDLAHHTGVSVRLLRYYEEQGLLRPVRKPSGYREFHEDDIRVVRNIRTLLAAGLNTRMIADVLPCMIDEGTVLAPACPGMLPDLYREQERIDKAVADLLATRSILDSIIAAAQPATGEPDDCLVAAGASAG
ncbi:MerR family transcriptional regulator [Nocardia cyriacigeorgica]|uniref:MerR family transcriptional regulator n=1 Tax=Nocardia cyriacigeorgica TaxID=135487 RepID=A0ABX0CTM1_9NOCA|nr:MerR family transcriptional regulator [Nocardia cyriacigeorgica]NEW42072.1 MerR family transcriptional regulator [Nocardia cyriacigeorgica]NEW53122.1 MerR family transcriptional regulator [Nocardia cyriacigeorgica]NEW57167.1 MerR family transcriptional regulator [Nocardia cyriacigeorgica]